MKGTLSLQRGDFIKLTSVKAKSQQRPLSIPDFRKAWDVFLIWAKVSRDVPRLTVLFEVYHIALQD